MIFLTCNIHIHFCYSSMHIHSDFKKVSFTFIYPPPLIFHNRQNTLPNITKLTESSTMYNRNMLKFKINTLNIQWHTSRYRQKAVLTAICMKYIIFYLHNLVASYTGHLIKIPVEYHGNSIIYLLHSQLYFSYSQKITV